MNTQTLNPHTLTLPKALVTLLAGALFGFGLSLATMVQPEVVLSFLRFQDWGLMLVMGGAAGLGLHLAAPGGRDLATGGEEADAIGVMCVFGKDVGARGRYRFQAAERCRLEAEIGHGVS